MDVFWVTLVIIALTGFILTAFLGHARRLLVTGAAFGGVIPVVLAAWDPDGPCEDCFLNFAPGEWFVIGVVAATVLWLA
jgi:hypothetical protein